MSDKSEMNGSEDEQQELLERMGFERAWELRFAAVLTQPATLTRWFVYSLFFVHALVHIVAVPLHVGTWSAEGVEFFFVLMMVGAKVNALIDSGEYWRLFSAIWLHASLLHLFLNAMALHYLGRMVENTLGLRAFLTVFLASGLMGSLCSYWFSDAPSVGASGAIFGLLGAAASYGLLNRKRIPQRLKRFLVVSPVVWIVLNLFISLLIPKIDMAAHSGGLVMGFCLAPLLGDKILVRRPVLPHRLHRIVGGVLVVGALIGAGFMLPRLFGQAPGISLELRSESVGGGAFSVPSRWRKGVLAHGQCTPASSFGSTEVGAGPSAEVCFEDPYQAILFIYPIDLLETESMGDVLGETGGSPAGFLRVTDKDDVPIYRRKQSREDSFSLFIAPARDEHTFVLRTWTNLAEAYQPLMRALVQDNSRRE